MTTYYDQNNDLLSMTDGMNPAAMATYMAQEIEEEVNKNVASATQTNTAALATILKQLDQPLSVVAALQSLSGGDSTSSTSTTVNPAPAPAANNFTQSWGGGVRSYPYDPNQPDQFNTNLPNNFNGSGIDQFAGDKDSTCGRLEYLIDYMMEHPSNPNAGPALFQYLQNLMGAWDQFSPSQQAQLAQLLSKNITDGAGNSLGQFIVDTLVESSWFSTGSSSQAHDMLNQLMAELGAMGGDSSKSVIVKDAYDECRYWQDNLDTFIQGHSDPNNNGKPAWPGTFTDGNGNQIQVWNDLDGTTCWDYICSDNSGNYGYGGFVENAHSSFASWCNSYYQTLINQIMAGSKDPQLLLMLMQVLFNQGGDMDNHLGGLSDPMNSLSDCENELSSILQEFQTGAMPNSSTSTGQWTEQGAQQFMQELFALQTKVDNDPSLSGIREQVDAAVNSLFGIGITNPDGTTTSYTGPGTGGNINNIGSAYLDYMACMQKGDTEGAAKDMYYITQTLTNINPSANNNSSQSYITPINSDSKLRDDPPPTPSFTVFDTVVKNLNSAVTAVQDQSQVQGTLVSSYSELYKQFLSMLSGFTDPNTSSLVALTNTLIQNQKSA